MSAGFLLLIFVIVLAFSGLMAMAGLGAAFLFVPLFYYMGIPLDQAAPAALLLNTISLLAAAVAYWKAGLIQWRIGLPVLILAVIFSPLGAMVTPGVNKAFLLGLFVAFLLFAASMMLFYKQRPAKVPMSRGVEVGAGGAVGAFAGFLGGLLGVGGGNFILPVLNGIGMETKVAAATTSVIVMFSSFSGFLGHMSVGKIDPVFLTVAGIRAVLGSLLGSWIMKKKISGPQLKVVIAIILYAVAVKMGSDVLHQLHAF
ncbi:MAG: sulfite exporter TauE/SafE family protein [Spirochaetales bacterium]|nr:sulfite exporter TauE/SafE family protein [Spirochaetales bacterium]